MKTKTVEPKYSVAQETELRELGAAGSITPEVAAQVAERWGKAPRAVVAKIVSMKLPYAKKERAKKSEAGATKADLVASIGRYIPGNLEGLENAPRGPLELLLSYVSE